MSVIKFSHCYQKLLDRHNDAVEYATLLDVIEVDVKSLSKHFIAYDTDNGKYELPISGKFLMLLFLKPHENFVTDKNLFTTLRRKTPEKLFFYKSRIGEKFEIKIK